MKTKILAIILMVLFPVIVNGQPLYSFSEVKFYFKLYDQNGKQIDYELFCNNYQLFGGFGMEDLITCTNKNIPKSSFYNDSTKFFNVNGIVVENVNLMLKFIHQTDTMFLDLDTKGGKERTFKIDSLTIKHGIYLVKEHSLPYINFEKGKIDYYNRFKQKYNIDLNDDKEKKHLPLKTF